MEIGEEEWRREGGRPIEEVSGFLVGQNEFGDEMEHKREGVYVVGY